ncbi:3'-5' exonuclease, partial [Candidatus Dependentiae bacterium]
AQGIKELLGILEKITKKSLSPVMALETLLELTEYKTYLKNNFDDEESKDRTENVTELGRCAQKFEERCLSGQVLMDGITVQKIQEPTLRDFLNEVSLIQQETRSKGPNADAIQLMTLHSAKGLEFKTVLMPGNEEGMLPSFQSIGQSDSLEEERRLFYVGITRAKERLILINVTTRAYFGTIKAMDPSRFLGELPQTLIKNISAQDVPFPILKRSLASWLSGKVFLGAKKEPSTKIAPRKKQVKKIILRRTQRRTTTIRASSPVKTGNLKKNRTVYHEKFGHGLITGVKKLHNGEMCMTVSFKTGTKKILSKFLKML